MCLWADYLPCGYVFACWTGFAFAERSPASVNRDFLWAASGPFWLLGVSRESITRKKKSQVVLPELQSIKLKLMLLSTSKTIEHLAITNFLFLLMEIVDKVEVLAKEVEALGAFAGARVCVFGLPSSSTASFSLDLYHSRYFKVKPLTYIDSEMVTVIIGATGFKFEDMKEYVETKTHSIVTGLYYFNKGLNNIKCDADFTVFVEKWQSDEGRMAQLYVYHKNADLDDYIGKDLGDYILVELKPGYDVRTRYDGI
ncbi:hypothetical protein Tco_1407426, partial [Tanacetum coccineum]